MNKSIESIKDFFTKDSLTTVTKKIDEVINKSSKLDGKDPKKVQESIAELEGLNSKVIDLKLKEENAKLNQIVGSGSFVENQKQARNRENKLLVFSPLEYKEVENKLRSEINRLNKLVEIKYTVNPLLSEQIKALGSNEKGQPQKEAKQRKPQKPRRPKR
ncbi:hypothetical protein ACE939_06820 [Aquimarina sp. W85]|uniref:hypothetical protein n=1 Tax=Aquimarina rhodophyticola TaxID=3342246 RepID=UPI00366D61FF